MDKKEISLIKYDWREIDRALLYYKVEDVNSAVKKILERIEFSPKLRESLKQKLGLSQEKK